MENLSITEMTRINGGSAASEPAYNLSMSSSSESLLSLTVTTTRGDHTRTDSLSIGNNISLELSAWLH